MIDDHEIFMEQGRPGRSVIVRRRPGVVVPENVAVEVHRDHTLIAEKTVNPFAIHGDGSRRPTVLAMNMFG